MGSEVARLLEAVDFAARKHKEQRRMDPEGTPYINHPIGAEPPPGTASRFRETPAAPLTQRTAHHGTLPAPARCRPPGAPHPGPGRQPCPLSSALSFGPIGVELPKHSSPGPGSGCSCPRLWPCRAWGPWELLKGPRPAVASARPGDSPHPGGTASPWDLPACPAEGFTAQEPAGCPLPRAGLGEATLPTVRRSPRVRARSCRSPLPPPTFPFSPQPWPGSWRMKPA